MSRKNRVAQTSFLGGEVSTKIVGQFDREIYPTTMEELTNFIVTPQGPITRRPGTRHLGGLVLHDPNDKQQLIPFTFSDDDSYMIVADDDFLKFIKTGDTSIAANVTQSFVYIETVPSTITWQDIGGGVFGLRIAYGGGAIPFRVFVGDVVHIEGFAGGAPNKSLWVQQVQAGQFDVHIDADPGTWTPGICSIPFTIPFAINRAKISFVQSADIMYLVTDEGTVLKKLSRLLTDTQNPTAPFTLVDLEDTNGPWEPENATAITLNPSNVTGTVTITASAAVFVAEDVGRSVRIENGSGSSNIWGYAIITAFGSSTSVTALVIEDFQSSTGTVRWQLGSWFPGNCPFAVQFYQQRLCFAGSPANPQTVWMSQTGDFENFQPDTYDAVNDVYIIEDSDAVTFTIDSNEVSRVRWLFEYRGWLLCGTGGGIFSVSGADRGAITPLPGGVDVRKVSTIRCGDIAPIMVEGTLFVVEKKRRNLFELIYDGNTDEWVGPDGALIADHLTERTHIHSMAYQNTPWKVIWMSLGTGGFIGMTYDRLGGTRAWHQHELGSGGSSSDGFVRYVGIAPSPLQDILWLLVARHNGVQVQYVLEFMWIEEPLSSGFYSNRDEQGIIPNYTSPHIFLDGHYAFSGGNNPHNNQGANLATNSFVTLRHKDGLTDPTMIDDQDAFIVSEVDIDSGKITPGAGIVPRLIGHHMISEAETQSFGRPVKLGNIEALPKKFIEYVIRALNIVFLKVGDSNEVLQLRDLDLDPAGTSISAKSGDFEVVPDDGFNTHAHVVLKVDIPTPATIQAIIAEFEFEED